MSIHRFAAGLALAVIEFGGTPRRLAVQETIGPSRVESDHPVPDDLKTNPADFRRLGAPRAVVDCSKRQQAPSLRAIFRFLRQTPQPKRVEIASKR